MCDACVSKHTELSWGQNQFCEWMQVLLRNSGGIVNITADAHPVGPTAWNMCACTIYFPQIQLCTSNSPLASHP